MDSKEWPTQTKNSFKQENDTLCDLRNDNDVWISQGFSFDNAWGNEKFSLVVRRVTNRGVIGLKSCLSFYGHNCYPIVKIDMTHMFYSKET